MSGAQKGKPSDADQAAGLLVKEARIAHGLSRAGLAAKVGVSHQQFQKYENGENRISVGRLCEIAEALGMPAADLIPSRPQEAA